MASELTKLTSLINAAENTHDLVQFLDLLPIQNLKQYMINELQTMQPNKLKILHFQMTPLNNFFCTDLIQKILSFIPDEKSLKYINKSFNALLKKNTKLMIKFRQEKLLYNFQTKQTWYVDHTSTISDMKDLALKIKRHKITGIKKTLHDALNTMKSGDKILLSDGTHKMYQNFKHYSKNIQIEGTGNNCSVVTAKDDLGDYEENINQDISISNVILVNNGLYAEKSKIYLTDCRIANFLDVENCTLDCMRCYFKGKGHDCSAIQISGESSLLVSDCLFEKCGGRNNAPVIEVFDEETANIKIIGNRFASIN
eukprot:50874_1